MKLHSGWLAAALLLFALLACNLGKNINNSNNSNSNKSSSGAEVYVDRIHMAKDDGGKPGDSSSTFAPDERTVHTVIVLNKGKAGTKIRFVWIAADVEGAKNRELGSIDYTTKGEEDNVHGHLTWSKDWPKGEYRSEVYINGVLDKTIKYTVE